MNLLRFWFGFSQPVTARIYLRHGAGLMVVKYLVDATVTWSFTGHWWTPLDYTNPIWTARSQALGGVPPAVMLGLAVWTLPFLWIGLSMSLRRAVDAGKSPWVSLLFFVPLVNLLFMTALCILPSVPKPAWSAAAARPVVDERLKSAIQGLGAALAVTIPTVLLSVYFKRSYSIGLFLGTPFTIGWITAHVYNRGHPRTIGQTLQVVLISLLIASALLLLLAAEGAFCLALAFPLAAVVAALGALFGRAIAIQGETPPSGTGLAALLAPLLVLAEPRQPPPTHEVLTTIEIAAPPETVWRNVVSFPDLPPPTETVFRIGVAAPLRARIVGHGVGAVRYCDFTTGSFVEPITTWEENHRLGFDIVRQAPPMREWSPYRDINPPHLDGYFRATHGEFRLIPLPDGRTRLEGRTTYQVEMAPQGYWSVAAERIVSAIHLRVLRHIRTLAEARQLPRSEPSSGSSRRQAR